MHFWKLPGHRFAVLLYTDDIDDSACFVSQPEALQDSRGITFHVARSIFLACRYSARLLVLNGNSSIVERRNPNMMSKLSRYLLPFMKKYDPKSISYLSYDDALDITDRKSLSFGHRYLKQATQKADAFCKHQEI